MSPKALTLTIAILSTVATALLAVGEVLPPQWALLVAALGAGAYGIARALQKVAAGQPLKAMLATTETWGAALVALAAIASAVAGVVPPTWAAGVAAGAAVLLKIARVVQSLNATVAVSDDAVTAAETPSAKAQEIIDAARGPQS
jgi:hypothetical protein